MVSYPMTFCNDPRIRKTTKTILIPSITFCFVICTSGVSGTWEKPFINCMT